MIKFAFKNLAVKKVQSILIVLSILVSAGVAVLAYNVSTQVEKGITKTAGYYSAIVGPAGSQTQLAMNTMYFTDSPLGTIPYRVVNDLEMDSRVTKAIPFAMADSYNGYSIVGSTSAFLDGKKVAFGKMFDDAGCFEVVVGSRVAEVCDLKVGSEIFTSHSAGEMHKTPFVVVGILDATGTVYDKTVFTQLKSIWEVHEHEEEEHDHEEEEEHDHEEMDGMVCAVLVRTKNPAYAMTLVNDYKNKVVTDEDGDTFSLQAIEPMQTVREVLNDADQTKYIVFVLSGVILAMNFVIIGIITLLNTYHAKKEIALMRLIGVSTAKINLLYLIQNLFIGLIAIGAAFGFSRICLAFMGDFVANMGVVLNAGTIYWPEIIILFGVLAVSVLPTVIWTAIMARRDSAENA
ncbi:MAG: ABC transporter permease [Clostridia bacterium]|nr:ABC transporter permease [Clostridia bacterium]